MAAWQTTDPETIKSMTELIVASAKQLSNYEEVKASTAVNLRRSRVVKKVWFDKNHKTGVPVLVHVTTLDDQRTDKLAEHWEGPLMVTGIVDGGCTICKRLMEVKRRILLLEFV